MILNTILSPLTTFKEKIVIYTREIIWCINNFKLEYKTPKKQKILSLFCTLCVFFNSTDKEIEEIWSMSLQQF